MRRRDAVAGLLVGTIAAGTRAQPALPQVGFLNSTSPGPAKPLVAAFLAGLAELGFVEGKSVAILYRWGENHTEWLTGLAADLVTRGVAAIASSGGDRVAVAAKEATATVPIVATIGGDPIARGLVASLAHPGGNL